MTSDHADSDHADSAGTPWAGRRFERSAFTDDDGSTPAGLAGALAGFRTGACDVVAVVEEIRVSRLLIPLLTTLGETANGGHGLVVDKSADLAVVTVSGPDGRAVMPVFSSVERMVTWNPDARPVPAAAVRVALAAASEGTELVVLDPGSPTEFAVRRPALWAIARSRPWRPGSEDPDVLDAFAASVGAEPHVVSLSLAPGDPTSRLTGPETMVRLTLVAGLDESTLAALLTRLGEAWAASETITERVDSLAVVLEAST